MRDLRGHGGNHLSAVLAALTCAVRSGRAVGPGDRQPRGRRSRARRVPPRGAGLRAARSSSASRSTRGRRPTRPTSSCVLGSAWSVYGDSDVVAPAVRVSRRLVAAAVDADVPVLGICFGAQLLAHALGGDVRRPTPPGELGWLDGRAGREASALDRTRSVVPVARRHLHAPAGRAAARALATLGPQAFAQGRRSACSSIPRSRPRSSAGGPRPTRSRLRRGRDRRRASSWPAPPPSSPGQRCHGASGRRVPLRSLLDPGGRHADDDRLRPAPLRAARAVGASTPTRTARDDALADRGRRARLRVGHVARPAPRHRRRAGPGRDRRDRRAPGPA